MLVLLDCSLLVAGFLDAQDLNPDPIPTRLIPTGPDPEYRTIVTSFFITQVWPPWAKSEQLFGFYSAQRILLLDPEQKKLQQVLEFL